MEEKKLSAAQHGIEGESYQARVRKWSDSCFLHEITVEERVYRFGEESLELMQALDCTKEVAHQLVNYVWGRPAGETRQEVGGVKVCLALLCSSINLNMDEAAEAELARVWTKIEQIRAKNAVKPKFGLLATPTSQA